MTALSEAFARAGIAPARRKAKAKKPRVRVRYGRSAAPAVQNVLKAPAPPKRWPDMADVQAHMADLRGVLASAYPKIWGAPARGDYIYEVFMRTGNGNWSRILRTHERARAIYVQEKTPDSYVTMRNAVTHELIGEMGRATPQTFAALQEVLAELRECDPQAMDEVRSRAWRQGHEVEVSRLAMRHEILASQAKALMSACWLPQE